MSNMCILGKGEKEERHMRMEQESQNDPEEAVRGARVWGMHSSSLRSVLTKRKDGAGIYIPRKYMRALKSFTQVR